MIQFLLSSQNIPFSAALALMLAIALLEGVASLLGAGFSEFLDTMLPELDLDVDVDLPEAEGPPPLSRVLSWLKFGEVPALMLLVIFLTAFGLLGLGIQSMVQKFSGAMLPAGLASIPALIVAIPVVRVCGGVLAKFIPKDETEAVSEGNFIGRVAVITLGTAAEGQPAEAKLTDQFGQSHYIMVVPDGGPGEQYDTGSEVLIVKQQGSIFTAIRNPNPHLSKDDDAGSD